MALKHPLITEVKLYHYPLSRSLRVAWLLNELNVDYSLVRLKMLAGEGYSEEYTKINPNHTVPALQYTIDGKTETIIESSAIMRFIVINAALLPKKSGPINSLKLVPDPAVDPVKLVADFEQWFAYCTVTMDGVLWQMRVINDFRKAPSEEKALLDMYAGRFNEIILPQVEKLVEDGRQFALGENLSLVDIVLWQNLTWAKKYKFLNPWSARLKEYEKGLRSRPALRAALSDAHLFEKDAKL